MNTTKRAKRAIRENFPEMETAFSFPPQRQSKHPKVRVELSDGRTRDFSFPSSPSCSHWLKNLLRDIEHFIDEKGQRDE